MNKAQLIDALAQRLGDKRAAGAAVDGLVDVIVRTVQKGEKVNITGFGVFEKRARAARTARNPRTGETVRVRKTNVPAFRAGTTFKDVISGAKKLPRVTASTAGAGGATAVRTTNSASRTASPGTSATARTAAGTTKAGTAKAGASKSTAKATGTKSTAARTAGAATKSAATKTSKAAPKAAAKATSAVKSATTKAAAAVTSAAKPATKKAPAKKK